MHMRGSSIRSALRRLYPRTDAREEDRKLLRATPIRVDQGSEFISRHLDLWAYQKDIVLDFSRSGKPTKNSFIESFNGKFRAEYLNARWFRTLDDARQKMKQWRRNYSEVRPHSAIGTKVPMALTNGSGASHPP